MIIDIEQNHEICVSILKTLPQAYFLCDHSGMLVSYNKKLAKLLKGNKDDLQNAFVRDFSTDLERIIAKPWEKMLATIKGDNWQEIFFRAFNNQPINLEVNIHRMNVEGEQRLLVLLWDNNKKKNADQRINAEKKIEALGTLSGGIAHEYNNILMVIGGYIQRSLRELDADTPLAKRLKKASEATDRATVLSKQLLIFSGKQAREHKVCNLTKSLLSLRGQIEDTLPNNISLNYQIIDDISKSSLDQKQFEETIMHLVNNAIQAMPMGGEIVIQEENILVEEDTMLAVVLKIPPGEYVSVKVTDTGIGIDSSILDKIFDPFFTTQSSSSAGLGLAVVYGFMRASNGYLNLASTLDEGTTVQLFFKKSSQSIKMLDEDSDDIPLGNGETILVVDDEDGVLNVVSEDIQSLGYEVITATDGLDGLEVQDDHDGNIDLVLSDVVMPGFTGPEMIRAMVKETPDLNYMFMSGFAPQQGNSRTKLPEGATLLAKPVEFKTLAQELKKALNGRSAQMQSNVEGEVND